MAILCTISKYFKSTWSIKNFMNNIVKAIINKLPSEFLIINVINDDYEVLNCGYSAFFIFFDKCKVRIKLSGIFYTDLSQISKSHIVNEKCSVKKLHQAIYIKNFINNSSYNINSQQSLNKFICGVEFIAKYFKESSQD